MLLLLLLMASIEIDGTMMTSHRHSSFVRVTLNALQRSTQTAWQELKPCFQLGPSKSEDGRKGVITMPFSLNNVMYPLFGGDQGRKRALDAACTRFGMHSDARGAGECHDP